MTWPVPHRVLPHEVEEGDLDLREVSGGEELLEREEVHVGAQGPLGLGRFTVFPAHPEPHSTPRFRGPEEKAYLFCNE